MLRKLILPLAALAIFLSIAGTAFSINPDSFLVSRQYNHTKSSGLAWDGQNMWTCSAYTGLIYKHAMDDKLSVVKTYPSPAGGPYGLAWDGSNLWSVDWLTKKIYKHNMDDTLSVAQAFDTQTKHYLVGLAWDGSNLWSNDMDLVSSSYSKIRKHNMDATLSIAVQYDGPFDPVFGKYAEIRGLTWYDNELWATNYLRHFPASVINFSDFSKPAKHYTLPAYINGSNEPIISDRGWTGLVWINNRLFLSNYFYPLTELIPEGVYTSPDSSPDDGSAGDGSSGDEDGGNTDDSNAGNEDAGGDGSEENPGEEQEEPFTGNTPSGSNVSVSLERGLAISFGNILAGGETSISFNDSGPYGPPSGFRYRNNYFTISTTAIYEGPVSITVDYSEADINGNDKGLKLYHRQNDTWVDITTLLDRQRKILMGRVDRL